MLFLFDVCNNLVVMQVLYFASRLFEILFTILPIILILIITISLVKGIIQNKLDDKLKDIKKIGTKLLLAILVFMIPWIVNLFFSVFNQLYPESKSDYLVCLNNVKGVKNGSLSFDNFEQIEDLSNQLNNNLFVPGSNPNSGPEEFKAAELLVKRALAEEGNRDSVRYNTPMCEIEDEDGNKKKVRCGWCAFFVSWNLKQTKYKNGSVFDYINSTNILEGPGQNSHAGSPHFLSYTFQQDPNLRLEKAGGLYKPKKGDIIFYNWSSVGSNVDHVGIVVSSDNDYVYTIEGNTTSETSSSTVAQKKRPINWSEIQSYGVWY